MVKKVLRKRRSLRRNKLATQKYVKRMISKESETKFHDLSDYVNAIDNTGTVVRLTGVQQGITDSTRIGDKLTLRALKYKLFLTIADTYNIFRVIMFQWYVNTTLRVPQYADIMQEAGGAVTSWLSPITYDYENQHHVISDKIYTVDSVKNQTFFVNRKFRMKYIRKTINFTAAGAEGSNHLYMLIVSDSAAIAHPTWSIQSRTYYDDA